jgi:plastocyanin
MEGMRRRSALVSVALGVTVLALGACGGDEEEGPAGDSGGGAAQVLKLSADPGGALKFDKTELTAQAGTVTIDFNNPSSVPHAVEVEGEGIEEETEEITKGTAKLTVELEPGEYEFYCPVGNHKERGMEGKLTVS